MLYLTFVSLLLPSFLLAAPFEIVLVNHAPRRARPMIASRPSTLSASTTTMAPQTRTFDPTGVNCTGTLYNDRESTVTCTGGRTLDLELGAPNRMQKYQFVHMWVCRDSEWVASTTYQMDQLSYMDNDDGSEKCTAGCAQNLRDPNTLWRAGFIGDVF
ncbi:hypothetical protein K505DRAFT_338915 [Melanomma pulvis-pyrius CBS 109.77]|uniref:Uncharacterized protein n=1 Tax=Melanomma pulvis-pyrius CBS 109.77 TaxID=1314802 RepID=A0A6A6X7E2_9PLEO|nr:hypothetical protein K505DRAFT_338915 [Melanomma pulvis-pyrius CBS 109.77]